MTLLHPWTLLLLLLLPVIAVLQRTSLADLSKRRRSLAIALRGIIFALLALALCDPRWRQSLHQAHTFFLIDASRSMKEQAADKAKPFIDAALKDGFVKPGNMNLIGFARNARLIPDTASLASGSMKKQLADDATDIAGGLQFAEASFPPGFTRNVVLFSDGQATRGGTTSLTQQLTAAGIRVFTVPVEPVKDPEVLVREVTAPPRARSQEKFTVGAVVVSNQDNVDATLKVFRHGALMTTKPVKLTHGENKFTFEQSVGEDSITDFTVEVESKSDTLADNNQATAYVHSAGEARVLIIADKPEQARYLGYALRQEGIKLDVRPATAAPYDLGELQNYELLIFDNISATDLRRPQMLMIASWVRDFGGGFLMLGGDQAFGLGGYYHTAIEDILPVRCDFEKEQENPSLGLVMVIDRSGSMEGEKMELAKAAAKASVELLGPRDYVGVVAFDSEAFWVAELQGASDAMGVKNRISTIAAGGGTNIAPGMELAYRALSPSPAKIKHCIVFTDGVSAPGPFYELASRMAQEKITVSTVGIGDADRETIDNIARWGNGRSYYTDNAQSVVQIFAKETMTASKSAVQELPFLPTLVRKPDFLSGIPFDAAPFLMGYVKTKAKPTSEVWMLAEKGEPLLATWRYGLGQTAAFTSDARNRWAGEWLKWPGYAKFWTQIVRKLGRNKETTGLPMTVTREGDSFRLGLDAVDAAGSFIDEGLQAQVLIHPPDGKVREESLNKTSPGRFETTIATTQRGAHHLQVMVKKDGEIIEQRYITANVGYPDEYLLKPVDTDFLKQLATSSGGVFDPKPGDLADERSAIAEVELWPWLCLAALLVFLADVLNKRLPNH